MEAIFCVMSMVSVELTILVLVLVLVPRINFDFCRPFDEFLMINFCKYLGNRSVEGR